MDKINNWYYVDGNGNELIATTHRAYINNKSYKAVINTANGFKAVQPVMIMKLSVPHNVIKSFDNKILVDKNNVYLTLQKE